MRKILNYLPLQSYTKYPRRRIYSHDHYQDYNQPQPLKAITYSPHDYFLKHTFIPLSYALISTEHLSKINGRDAFDITKKMTMRENDKKINYDLFQKFLKVRILLLYVESRQLLRGFLNRASFPLRKITSWYLDHKYSEIYEEGVISKLVEVVKDYELVQPACERKETCVLIDRVISNNQMLIRHMGMVCDELNVQWDEKSRMNILREVSMQSVYEKKTLPIKLFEVINKPWQYSSDFNELRTNNNRYDDEYMIKLLTYLQKCQQREEYKANVEREVRYFENVKLTKIDFLVGLHFNLQAGFYRNSYFEMILDYMEKHESLLFGYQGSQNAESRILETLMIVRILGLVGSNMEKYGDSMEKDMLQGKLKDAYRRYLDLYAKMIESIGFQELHKLLGFHLKIFQQYFLVQFEEEATRARFKDIYYKLFSKILGYCENGLLLVESSKNINFVLEAILAIYNHEDQQLVLSLMEQYENILPLLPWINQPKKTFKYKADYLICIKYGFKSDIIAERLLRNCELQAWVREQNDKNVNKKYVPQTKEELLLDYFLYLSIAETKSGQADGIERQWISLLGKISVKTALLNHKSRDKRVHKDKHRHHNKHQNERSFTTHAVSLLINQQISYISELLWMMAHMLENSPSQAVTTAIKDKITSCFYIEEFLLCIMQNISFPNVYNYLKRVTSLVEIDNTFVLQELQKIEIVVKEAMLAEPIEVKSGQRMYYEEYSHFLENFAVYINTPIQQLYSPKNYKTLLTFNTHLSSVISIKPMQEQKQYKPTTEQLNLIVRSLNNIQLNQEKKAPLNRFPIRYFERGVVQEFAARYASANKQEDSEFNKQKEKKSDDFMKNWESYHDNFVEEDKKKDNKMAKSYDKKVITENRPFARSKIVEEVNQKRQEMIKIKNGGNENVQKTVQQKSFFKNMPRKQTAQTITAKPEQEVQESQESPLDKYPVSQTKRAQKSQRKKEWRQSKLILPLQRIKERLMEVAKLREQFYLFQSQHQQLQKKVEEQVKVKPKARKVTKSKRVISQIDQ